MVSAFQMQQTFFGAPLTVDTTRAQKFFGDDEDASILDDNILDHSALDSGLDMSPPTADSRRDSFAVSVSAAASMFSPKTEDWQSVDMRSVPSNNPFLNQHSNNNNNNNPFMQPPPHQHHQPPPPHSAPFQGPWAVTSSGSATPLQPCYDGLPTEFDAGVTMFQRPAPMQGQTPFSNPSNQVPMFQQLPGSMPPSPTKEHWMAGHQAMVKRSRPSSPGLLRSHNELRRGDGIRKKNARFDIPAERNLSNIDNLIAQTSDEVEIKELKQQKRLLRNRQAALDSRQRKKQHTERLEDEKKQFTEAMNGMQDEMARLEQEMSRLLREKASYEAYIAELEQKHVDMIEQHTRETGNMRKKISVLTNHITTLEAANQPQPSMPGAFGEFGDMDGLSMDAPWDVGFGEFAPLDQQPPPPPEIKQEMQVVAVSKPAKPVETFPVEEPKQGGLLFMLFLVGAFVLSSRSTPSIPRVSEDIRSMSANLLETVLKDAGVPQTSASTSTSASAPAPSASESGSSWSAPTVVPAEAPSMLVEMADALTQPSEQQANEQLFGLSAAQYNGVVGGGESPVQLQQQSTSRGRRNLADALANMNVNRRPKSGGNGGKESAGDVYTRSLLWDQIPSDVVRTFAKMVAESNKERKAKATASAEVEGR